MEIGAIDADDVEAEDGDVALGNARERGLDPRDRIDIDRLEVGLSLQLGANHIVARSSPAVARRSSAPSAAMAAGWPRSRT